LAACKELQATDETTHQFRGWACWSELETVRARAAEQLERDILLSRTVSEATARLDAVVSAALGFRGPDLDDMEAEFAACERISTGPWSPGYARRTDENYRRAACSLLSLAVGTAMGRFDIRLAGQKSREPVDPFSALPRYAEGALRDQTQPREYPVSIAEDGILVDDEGHQDDVVKRLREVLHSVASHQADAIEYEACQAVGLGTLHDYFTRHGGKSFWGDHFRQYSKGRRRAPIYWLLRSPRGLYSVWIYYHRLNSDTLHRLLGPAYLESKVQRTRQAIEELRPGGQAKVGMTKKDERRLADLDDLLVDLEEFRAKIQAVVGRTNDRGETVGYDPDLDDGVVLNAAPLHELIPWPRKKKHQGRTVSELTVYWDELAEGKYDWAHLAMRHWPARVREKCRTDKSLALAHGLDAEFFPGLREELRRQAESTAGTIEPDDELVVDEADDEEEDDE
jgi:hypothetical protein